MSFVFNISKGEVNALVKNVQTSTPATARLVVVAINTTETEVNLKRLNTLADVLANLNTAEVANTGYARLMLTNTDVTAVTPDDVNDYQQADTIDFNFGNIEGDDVNWTDLLVCYDPDNTAGTDANIIPLTCHDYLKTPDGSPIVVLVNGFFRAS